MTAHADTNRPSATPGAAPTAAALHGRCAELKAQKNWDELGTLIEELPRPFDAPWVPAADEIAFGLTQLNRFAEARDIFARIFAIEPNPRTASALAYVHYAALLCHKVRKPRLDEPEPWRKGFEHWITEALRLRPDSIVDRYRLGIYHASIQTRKDVLALKAFYDTLRLFEALPAEERTEQGRFWKTYVKTLYATARSAHRLGRFDEARRLIFRCYRLDRERNHVEPVFKLFLAAKVLVAENKLEDAERGLRLAIEAPHQGDRDFVYALLAEIALAQGRTEDAAHWIEHNILPHHRKPYVWRLLGDCAAKRGRRDQAIKLYKSSLLKDHGGRHITLVRMGRLFEDAGRTGEAKHAYDQAADFRRRKFLSEDPEALEALAKLCEHTGDLEGARTALQRLSRLPMFAEQAERDLARLAG